MKQNPKDPVFLVRYRTGIKRASSLVDEKGRVLTTEDWAEDAMTVHAADEAAAKAYIQKQNPDIEITGVEKAGEP